MPSKDPKPTPAWPDGKVPATLHEFYRCLEASRALTAEEARQFVASLPEGKQPDTPKAVAIELIKAGKLTRFQAQAVLQGKIKYLTFGDYVVLERLGRGGMGEVLKAEHRRMQRTVALKVISGSAMKDADAVRRFQREVHAAARLIHPNIVTAFDANEHEGVHFLVMEHVAGRDLAAVVHDQGPLPVATAIDYVLQAARGLAYAHSKGIVHRDIKPGNLLVDRDGTVKILDMGLARIDLGAGSSLELTNTGQVMGTVDYMAPEQAEDTHSADARADIYSLGCTLYRLLSGNVLYGGESVVKKLLAHRGAPIPPLGAVCPSAPAALDATFRKMVAKRPEDRQQSMAEVVAELEKVLRALTAVAPGAGPTEPTVDLKLSEFLAGIGSRSGKSSPTATAPKSATKFAAATEVTQDLAAGDTTTTGLAGLGSAAVAKAEPAAKATLLKKRSSWLARHPIASLIAAALGGLALAAAGIVVFLPTSDGTIRVEINDPSIEVTVSGSGYTIKGKTEEIHIKPGDHTLHVKTGELELDTNKFTLGKGANPAVKVELLPGKVQVVRSDGRLLGEKPRVVQQPAAAAPASSNAPVGSRGSAVPGPWVNLFNGRDLYGWLQKGHAGWSVKDGLLTGESVGAVGWLMSSREFGDFELELEYRLPPGGNSGVFVRAPESGNITGGEFNEIQLLDDSSPKFASVVPQGRNGALFSQIAPTKAPINAANEWRKLSARVVGSRVQVTLDGVEVIDGPLRAGTAARGHVGLQLYAPGIAFRSIRLRELQATGSMSGSNTPPAAAGGFALQFDEKSSVAFPGLSLELSDPFTLEAYVTQTGMVPLPAGNWPSPLYALNCVGLTTGDSWGIRLIGRQGTLVHNLEHKPVFPGRRTHVAAVSTGQQLRLFVDGSLVQTKDMGVEQPQKIQTTLKMGYSFVGIVDELRVSKIARYDGNFTPAGRFNSDASTLALYHFDEGQGDVLNDSSGNGHHGKIVGAKWVPADNPPLAPQSPLATQADVELAFDGRADHVVLPSLNVPGRKLTVEFSATLDDLPPREIRAVTFSPFAIGVQRGKWGVTVKKSDNEWFGVPGAMAQLGRRTHVAAVFEDDAITVLVDGKQLPDGIRYLRPDKSAFAPADLWKRIDFDPTEVWKRVAGSRMMLGGAAYPFNPNQGDLYLRGRMDELRVSQVARYHNEFTPAKRFEPDADTVALYHFGEGQGEVLTDSSGNGHHGQIVGAKWVRSENP